MKATAATSGEATASHGADAVEALRSELEAVTRDHNETLAELRMLKVWWWWFFLCVCS